MPDEIDYKTLFEGEKKKVAALQQVLSYYEKSGAATLYYALNRKMNEMANVMNSNNLSTVALDDPKDKTFDRMKVIWNDAANISTAVKALADVAGITNDEEKDTAPKKTLRMTPETIADALGNSAGQIN